MSNRCKHGTYVGDWAGPDYICGQCEDGLCVHGNKVSGFAWEDVDGCDQCPSPGRKRTVASLAVAQRIAQYANYVRFNPDRALHKLVNQHTTAADLLVMVTTRMECDAWRTAEEEGRR